MIQSKILLTSGISRAHDRDLQQQQRCNTNQQHLPQPSNFQYRTTKNFINSDNKPNLSHYLSAPQLFPMPSQATSYYKNDHQSRQNFGSSTAQADKLPITLKVPNSSDLSKDTADRVSQPLKSSKSQSNAAVVSNFQLITNSVSGFKSMLFLTPPKIGTKVSASIKKTKAGLHLSSTCSHQSNTQSSFMHQQQHSSDVVIKDTVHAFTLDQNLSSDETSIEYRNTKSQLSDTDGGGDCVDRAQNSYDGDDDNDADNDGGYDNNYNNNGKQQENGDQSMMSDWDNKFNSLLESPTTSNKLSSLGYQPDNENFSQSVLQNGNDRNVPKIDIQHCDFPNQQQQSQFLTERNKIQTNHFYSNGFLTTGLNSDCRNNNIDINGHKTLTYNSSAPLLSKIQSNCNQIRVQSGCAQVFSAQSRKNCYEFDRQCEQQQQQQQPLSMDDGYQQNNMTTSSLMQLASNLFQNQSNSSRKFYNSGQNMQFCDNRSGGERRVRSQYKGSFNFPDGGWVCCVCQNYNFYGRSKCNRCGKLKSKMDVNGKPRHLIKKQCQYFNQNQQYYLQTPTSNSNNNNQHQYSYPSQFISSPTNQDPLLLMQQHDEMTRQQQCQQQQQPNSPSMFSIYNPINSNSIPTRSHQQPVQLSLQQQQIQQQRSYKKPLTQRIGDWVCLNCRNLNFSFRVICNRCNLSREIYGQYVNKEAQLMLPSINSQSSSSSSSHNIPVGVSAPQQHYHYFNPNSFNLSNELNNPNDGYAQVAINNNGNSSSLPTITTTSTTYCPNIQSPVFNHLNTGKENKTNNLRKRSSDLQQQQQDINYQFQQELESKSINEQQEGE